MSVCVALRVEKDNKKRIIVGSDSANTSGDFVLSAVDSKIFRLNKYVITYAGDVRVGQVVKYFFKPPTPPSDPNELYKFMVTVFTEELITAMAESGHRANSDNGLGFGETDFIVVVNNRMFWISPDMSVVESTGDMLSIGAGREYALGSLYTSKEQEPHIRVVEALNASGYFCSTVKPPYIVIDCS